MPNAVWSTCTALAHWSASMTVEMQMGEVEIIEPDDTNTDETPDETESIVTPSDELWDENTEIIEE